MSRLEELQKAVDDTGDAWDAALAAKDAALDAYSKAMQELDDYKMEHGLLMRLTVKQCRN